ncbi:MAG: hypothetical protein RLZZ53_2467 [Acidobacteriota bacterium]|jgi:uncharacterized membrane protein YedE/YeeE
MNWTDIGLASLGGSLIGLAAVALLVTSGKTAGVSGILEGALLREPGEAGWKVTFLAGLLAGGLLLSLFAPWVFSALPPTSPVIAIAGGLLVGFGTRLSGGCTSGHGVCGMGRLSKRSLVAVIVFMGVGILVRVVL